MGIQPDKSDIGPEQPPQEPPAPSGVASALIVATVLGAVVGAAGALFFAPDLIVACAIGGAMTLAAVRVGILMSSDRRGLAPIKNKDGSME